MLSETVAGAARRFGERPAVCTSTTTVTWGEIHRAAETLAPVLAAAGIGPGVAVGLSLRSGPQWVMAAVAVDRAGGTIAGLSPIATAHERAAMVDLLGPRLLLAQDDLLEGVPAGTEVMTLDQHRLGSAPSSSPTIAGGLGRHDRSDDRPFAVCFTSGTSGVPKAARFEVLQAREVQRIDLGGDPGNRWGGGGPMIASTQFAHVGFVLKLATYARLGTTMHVMERWNADEAIELLAAQHMTTLGAVAPQVALILRSALLEQRDLSALSLVIAGGAPSPPALVREARDRLGVDYSVRWSSTESGGVGLAARIDDDNPDAIGTIGRPREGISARVVGDGGVPAPIGSIGELQIRSAAMMSGYLGAPGATAAAFTPDGWLRTGDLASVRDDGRFVPAGRRSDMFIRGGYNVHPEEVEAVLATHVAVAAVAVAPRADPVMGEVGVAMVVPVPGAAPPTLDELRSHAAGSLARHKLPEDIVICRDLPLTTASKVDRRRLAERVRR